MTNLSSLKNKHLNDLKAGHEESIALEFAEVGKFIGYPLEADQAKISELEASIEAIDTEFSRRGVSSDDGCTIIDEARYDAWIQATAA